MVQCSDVTMTFCAMTQMLSGKSTVLDMRPLFEQNCIKCFSNKELLSSTTAFLTIKGKKACWLYS